MKESAQAAPDSRIRQRALQPDRSFLIQAPAGSGKTELLIQRRRDLDDKWGALGAMGALRTLQARLAWLGDVGKLA